MKVKGGYQIIDLSNYNVEMGQVADSVNATLDGVDLTDIISQIDNSNGKPIMFISPSMSMSDVYRTFGGGSAVITTPVKYGSGYVFDFSFLPTGSSYDLTRKITITANSISISVVGLP